MADSSFLTGARLYGDDFAQDQIQRWYEEEAEAYTDLYHEVVQEHEYSQWLDRYGFRMLPSRQVFEHVLGFGSGLGSEFAHHQQRFRHLSIVESSSAYAAMSTPLSIPISFVPAQPNGDIDLPSESIDLVACLGVLHHIPNVSHVVSEFSRVMRSGSYAVIREPIISMGDWSELRVGLTKNERGIPLTFMADVCARNGLRIMGLTKVGFPMTAKLARAVGVASPFNRPSWSMFDRMLCRFSSWNYRYHAATRVRKIRPTSAIWVLQK